MTRVDFEPTVGDLMTSDTYTLTEEDTLKAARDLMAAKGIRHVPVVAIDGRLTGLITHRDFLKLAVSKLAGLDRRDEDDLYAGISIKQVMGRKVALAAPDMPIAVAAKAMFDHKYGCLPVVQDGKLVGIVTEADFVRAFAEWNIVFRR